KYILPSILVFGLAYKKRTVVFGSVLAMVFLFLCGANKAVYFGIFMVIVFSFGDHFSKIKYFLLFVVLVALFGLFAFYAFDNTEIIRLSIRRLIFVPPLLDIVYFDFFENNHLYWSESIMSAWIEPQYYLHHSYLIGEKYFNS